MNRRNVSRVVLTVIVFTVILLYLLPYIWLVISSFRPSDDPFTRSVLPRTLTFANYVNIFTNANFMRPFFNSMVVSVSATLLTMFLAILAAYGFSRFHFRGRGFLLSFLINLRTFPALLLAIALYIMAVRTGLYNTYVPLILANAMLNLPFAIWNMKIVVDGIPCDLEESGMVDGLSRFSTIWRIIMPVATPGIAATAIYVFILTWNEYLFASTFMNTNNMQLVTVTIASATSQFGIDYGWLMSTAMLASIPVIVLFIAIQKFIVGGLTVGGVKG